MRRDCEVNCILVLVRDAGRDAVSQVDLAAGEVEILGITVIRENIAFETEPVAVELGIPLAALGKVARFCNLVLSCLLARCTA